MFRMKQTGKKFAHMAKKTDPRLAKDDRERRTSPPPKKLKDDGWKLGGGGIHRENDVNVNASGKINLYEMLCEQENEKGKDKWLDFVGRINSSGNTAVLYPNLNTEQSTHGGEHRRSPRMDTS